MKPKIPELREEIRTLEERRDTTIARTKQLIAELQEKSDEKVAALQVRIDKLNTKLTKAENDGIVNLVRAESISLEELSEFLRGIRRDPMMTFEHKEEEANEDALDEPLAR